MIVLCIVGTKSSELASVNFSFSLKEPELMWRYADFVLCRDQEVGVRIFTLRSDQEGSSDIMKPDMIVDYLHQYPKAVVKYLEHLVMKQEIQVFGSVDSETHVTLRMAMYLGRVLVFQAEKFHTHLAILYLEEILKKRKEGNEEAVVEARTKLRHLLQVSSLYRVQLLLGKMSDADLHQEVAILYGKVNIILFQVIVTKFCVDRVFFLFSKIF
jgi:hypothetical protein